MAGDIRPAPGKRRSEPEPGKIAARVAALKIEARTAPGVVMLNPGFFKLERMRSLSVAKKRSEARAKVRG